MFEIKFCYRGPFMIEKIPHVIGNQILPLKCGFGISYGIGRKYWPIRVSFLVSDLLQNSGIRSYTNRDKCNQIFPAHQFGNSKSQRAVSKNEVRNYFDATCTYVQTLPNGHIIRHFAIFAYFKSNAIHIVIKYFLKGNSEFSRDISLICRQNFS